jgi:hypothetical protein
MYITLFIYTLSVYGIAWILTQSHVTKPIRKLFPCSDKCEEGKLFAVTHQIKINKIRKVIGYFLRCIVCMSFWIGIGLAFLLQDFSLVLFHLFNTVGTVTGALVMGGYCTATSWILGRILGDAD